MSWYLEVLRKYAAFDGRARRKEYWMFSLVNTVIAMAIVFAAAFLGGAGSAESAEGAAGVVVLVYLLAIIVPSLAVTVRRLHDTNRSGLWMLISFIPLEGPIAVFVFTVHDGTPGSNQYGPNPKAVA